MTSKIAPRLVREAREASGLTQRALARRARTAQSVVARIEMGDTSPTLHTLQRLLRAAGFELASGAVPFNVFGVEVRAASLEDILRSKKAAVCPQDL